MTKRKPAVDPLIAALSKPPSVSGVSGIGVPALMKKLGISKGKVMEKLHELHDEGRLQVRRAPKMSIDGAMRSHNYYSIKGA